MVSNRRCPASSATSTMSVLPADHPGQKCVAQHMGRQLHARIVAQAAADIIDRPLGQPPPAPTDEQRPLPVAYPSGPLGPAIPQAPGAPAHSAAPRDKHHPCPSAPPPAPCAPTPARRRDPGRRARRGAARCRAAPPRSPDRAPTLARHPQQASLLPSFNALAALGQILAAYHGPPKPEMRVERIQRRERQVHRRRLPPPDRLQVALVIPHRPIPRIRISERVSVDRRAIRQPCQIATHLVGVRLPREPRGDALQPREVGAERLAAAAVEPASSLLDAVGSGGSGVAMRVLVAERPAECRV